MGDGSRLGKTPIQKSIGGLMGQEADWLYVLSPALAGTLIYLASAVCW
jgi:hypothetical protein